MAFLRIASIVLMGLILIPFLLYIGATAVPEYKALNVRSGSMEPSIPTGSVIYTRPVSDPSELKAGDVITFEEGDFLITHRIQEVDQRDGELFFVTKGDANEERDLEPVNQDRVEGRVSLVVPYLGYLIDRLNKIPGILLLVLIPAALLVYLEIENLPVNL